jgi:hypothetical protein
MRLVTLALVALPFCASLAACSGEEEVVHMPLSDLDGDGWVTDIDCDDADAEIGPALDWFLDDDGDGYGLSDNARVSCVELAGRVGTPGDCDDLDSAVNPAATEVPGDGVDQDCDGSDGPDDGGDDTGSGDDTGGTDDTGTDDTGTEEE